MEALRHPELPPEPDVSHLITEDDTPVDSVFSEKQMRLLTSALYQSWQPGRPFVAMANVGLFSKAENPAVVPDVMVSLDVTMPENLFEKGNRSYMVWRYGKPPDLVVEIVSNRVGGEIEKADTYARARVAYYVIFDPERHLGDRLLRGFVLHGGRYVDLLDVSWIDDLGLGLRTWEGTFEEMPALWLRPCDRDGNFLPLPVERAESERQRAETERERAEAERERAASAEERALAAEERERRLLARLRDLGLEEP